MEFSYKVKTQAGEITQGNIDALDENMAVDILHGKGYVVVSLTPLNKGFFKSDLNHIFSKPSTKDVVVFTRQLSTLVDADMPIAEGLRALARQVEKSTFKKIITEVSESVEAGSSLSNALSKYPKLFSSFYIKLVQSGEVTGKLHDSLLYLAGYLERSQSINSKIRGALAYPAFVIFAMVVVATIMTVYVLPQLLTIFKDIGVKDLPLTTRILIWVTDFVNENIYYLIIMTLVFVYTGWLYIRTPSGKAWLDNLKINIPTLGGVIKSLYLARIAESLSTLIKAGISILDALRITSELVGNENYRKIMLATEDSVRGGGSISEILDRYEEMPPLFTSMTAIGEKTGKLDFMLDHLSKFYRSESDNTIDNISQLIEPILILILGFGVAILVASILLPIYSLVGVG
ncbi:MAG: type II secretion system F family protein [Patescibacteria group bacterium]